MCLTYFITAYLSSYFLFLLLFVILACCFPIQVNLYFCFELLKASCLLKFTQKSIKCESFFIFSSLPLSLNSLSSSLFLSSFDFKGLCCYFAYSSVVFLCDLDSTFILTHLSCYVAPNSPRNFRKCDNFLIFSFHLYLNSLRLSFSLTSFISWVYVAISPIYVLFSYVISTLL